MTTIDWIFAVIPLLIVFVIGVYTRHYMRSVADFLSGGRLAGRYLLAIAGGELQAGAVVFVAMFEQVAKAGFTISWWSWMQVPIFIVAGISGFVIYRYRETRAMTLAQFFEIRYSKSFRLFTGFLGFFAGILNFGIIPVVTARFFVYFLGLPLHVTILSVGVPTFAILMGMFLSITVAITLSGGLVTVMITNCLEGIFSQILYVIIIVALLMTFNWTQITHVLGDRPAGHSLLNPFDSLGIQDFNLWYILMLMFVSLYGTMAWQNASAYNSAAITPHESRMGGVLGRWREMGKQAAIILLAVCAITFLQHPDFSHLSMAAHKALNHIGDPKIREQMQIPIALTYLLPVGVKGLLCTVLVMGVFGGDSSHLHSWGGIFVQDVISPLRRKPFSPKQHILALRLSIVGVAVFAFLFGYFFHQTEYIIMWWQVTTAIFVGGAGATIIGGLYWKKGTTAGAWTALLTGSSLCVGGILARQIYGNAFPLNGMQISFFATLIAIAAYVVVSFLTCKSDFNMDRMLHRGMYAIDNFVAEDTKPVITKPKAKSKWGRVIGIDDDFSRGDKWIAAGLFWWSLFWSLVMILGSIWNLVSPWSAVVWSAFWHVAGVGIPVLMAFTGAIWFTWGGVLDIRALFRRLGESKVNHLDNGTVVGHQNLDENMPGNVSHVIYETKIKK